MSNTAFVSLEDISRELPEYDESVIRVDMTGPLKDAYSEIQEKIKDALRVYPRNAGLISLSLNTLLCYADHPLDFKTLKAKVRNKQTGELEIVEICTPQSLPRDELYHKELALLRDVQEELALGRKVQIFATFTGEHDVTARLQWVLEQAAIRTAVLARPFQRGRVRPGTRRGSPDVCKPLSATPSWLRLVSIFSSFRPSTSTIRATRYIPCGRPAVDRGDSVSVSRYE